MNKKDQQVKELIKLNETVIKCPVCSSNSLKIIDYLYEVPLVGKAIITTGKCSVCGYKYNDVRLVETNPPRRIILEITSQEDLNALVVKASSASVMIPEIGLEMIPGPASQGFITTVEGLLERFKEAIEIACRDPLSNKNECSKLLKWIEDAKEGKVRFTLIILDPEGVSTIVSSKARIEPLNK